MTESGDSNGRDERGRFASGNVGGPGGSRRCASDLRRAAEDAISPDHIAAMVRKATRMALEGNLSAMRLVFDRTCGRATEAPAFPEPLSVELPHLRTAEGCNAAIETLIAGICSGETDRDLAKLLLDAIQTRLKAIEVTEFEGRLIQLEQDAQRVGGRR